MPNIKLKFLDKLIANPKQIFLMDALGALLTTILLLEVLIPFEKYFGMPSKVLYILSIAAFGLFTFSIGCNRFIKSNWRPFLGVVMVGNFFYSLVTLGWMFRYSQKLTELGFIYFILELLVIAIVIYVEYQSYSYLLKFEKK